MAARRGHVQTDLLADLVAEIGTGVPAAVLITYTARPHVHRLCLGEDVRLDPTAWEAISRGAPVIAAIVRNSGRYVRCENGVGAGSAWSRDLLTVQGGTGTACLFGIPVTHSLCPCARASWCP